MLERLKRKDFEDHVHSVFQVATRGGERADMSLVEVTGREDEYAESFSLMFMGPMANILPHDTHTVTHEKLGTFDLFLGPVMTGKTDAVYYQAVFSRMKK